MGRCRGWRSAHLWFDELGEESWPARGDQLHRGETSPPLHLVNANAVAGSPVRHIIARIITVSMPAII